MSPVELGSAYGKIELDSSGVVKATSESERAVQQMQRVMAESSRRVQSAMAMQAQKEQALAANSEQMGQRIANAWALQAQKAEALKAKDEALIDTALKVGTAFTAMSVGLGAGLYSATKLAARVETLGVVTATLGKNVGYTEGQIRLIEKAIQDQGITLQASRQAVAQMIEAEIDLGKATDLAREAQDAAVISGENSSETYQNLVYAIASGNVLMLRRMGILVNFQSAYQKEAEAIGKSSTALTEHEKLMIRTNAVIEAGKNITGAYEAAMETAGKKVTSLERHIEESKRMLGEAWLPVYAEVIDFVTNSLKAWEDLDQTQKDNISTLAGYTTIALGVNGAFLLIVGGAAKVKGALESLQIALHFTSVKAMVLTGIPVVAVLTAWTIAAVKFYEVTKQVEQGQKDVAGAWEDFLKKQADAGKDATAITDAYIERQKAVQKQIEEMNPILRLAIGDQTKLTGNFDALNKVLSETSRTYEEYRTNLDRALEGSGLMIDSMGNLRRVNTGVASGMGDIVQKNFVLKASEIEASEAVYEANEKLKARQSAARQAQEGDQAAAESAEALAEAQQKLAEAMANQLLQAGLAGELTKGWDDYQKKLGDLKKEHADLTAELGKTRRSELGVVAASNFVKEALSGANKRAYQPFLQANKDLIEKHTEIEKELVRARRLYGENSDEVEKYTNQLAANERQLVLAARSQDLEKQLDELKRQGYDPNSKAVQELNQKLAENEQAQKDAAAAASLAIKQFIYEKAALELPVEAATALAHSMGLIDDDTYNAVQAQQDLRQEYQNTKDLDTYIEKTGELAEIIERLKSKHIIITQTTIREEILRKRVEETGVGPGYQGPTGTAKAAGGPVFPGKPFRWNEPGYQGETMVIPTNGQILNRLDSMKAAQAAFAGAIQGRGGQAGDMSVVQNFFDRGAAAIGMAEIRRLQNDRLDKTM